MEECIYGLIGICTYVYRWMMIYLQMCRQMNKWVERAMKEKGGREGGRDRRIQRLVVNNGETWGEEVAGKVLGAIANACYLEEP